MTATVFATELNMTIFLNWIVDAETNFRAANLWYVERRRGVENCGANNSLSVRRGSSQALLEET